MYERLNTINRDDGNVVLIFSEQFVIRFDIDLLQRELIANASTFDRCFGLVAEVAAGARIDDYVWFHVNFLPANQEIRYK